MDSQEKPPYDDFIAEKPKVIQKFSSEIRPLLKEHTIIVKGLGKHKFLSVKEIRNLYWNEKEKKHTKSMKTIYRYMEILENANLVKVAGHRKPKDGRMTEKLYCRTATIYFLKDEGDNNSDDDIPYWKSEGYQKSIKLLAKIFIQNNDIDQNREKDFFNIVEKFTEMQSINIKTIFGKIEANPNLVEGYDEFSIMDFKRMISDLSMFEIIYQHPEFIKLIQDLK